MTVAPKQTIGLKRTFGFALEGTNLVGANGASRLIRVTYFDGTKITTAEATLPETVVRDCQSHEAVVAVGFARLFEELAHDLVRKAGIT